MTLNEPVNLQGPHQSAMKSTKTGVSDLIIKSSNFPSSHSIIDPFNIILDDVDVDDDS